MTVEDYKTISDSIETLETNAELLDCLGFLHTLSMLCVNKMFKNLPKRRFITKTKKRKLTPKREAWYRLANYYASLEAQIKNYKNG